MSWVGVEPLGGDAPATPSPERNPLDQNRCYKQCVPSPFINEPIPIDEIPQLTDDAFVPVDPRYLRASLAGTAVTAAVVLIGGSIIASQSDPLLVPAAITGGILLLIALSAVIRIMEVRRLAYQVRDHDISMRSGVITHRVESLPFARVQHVRVNRGAIERALGLATLQISSAGPNITIPGLSEAEASRIKLLVTQRAGMETEDADDAVEGSPAAPPTAPATVAATPPPAPIFPPTTPPVAPAAPPVAPPAPPTPPVAPPAPPTPPVE